MKRNGISSIGIAALLILSIFVPMMASASIAPTSFEATLKPGESANEHKEVTIPSLPPRADVILAFDLTGSMGVTISAAKLKAIDVMNNLSATGVDVQFAVASYMDYPHCYGPSYGSYNFGYNACYGASSSGDYAYKLNQPMTGDKTAVSAAINGLVLGYGGDGPQDYTRVLHESYADTSVGWRPGAKKIIINFADDIPHDNNLNEGVPGKIGTYVTGGDPGRDEVMGNADDLDLQTVLSQMAANNVILLEAQQGSYYNAYWDYWTGLTGGSRFAISSANFVTDVVAAVTTALTTPSVSDLHLEASLGYESWLTSVSPASYPTVASGEMVPFDLTLTVPAGTLPGDHVFTISALDGSGVSYGDQTVLIHVTSANEPPVAEAGGPYTVDEGSPVTLNGNGSTDPDGDLLSFAWDLGSFIVYENMVTITPPDGPATLTIPLKVEDGKGGVSTDTAEIAVNNVAPIVNAGVDATINEGDTFVGAGSFTDPGADTWTATVDYGDGSMAQALTLTGKNFNLDHTYPDDGVYNVIVTITDKDGGVGTDTMQVTVKDIPIDVGPISVSSDLVPIGTPFTAKSTITAASTDTGTATWNWDGPTETIPLASFPTTLSTPHTYTTAGVYTIALEGTDDDGNVDKETFQYVVVYDPNGGFVTGGVQIDSPAGAYTADPSLTGKAHAGFVSKYQKGATKPSGETEFQFQVADFNFHSMSYDWLVVAGARAQYKGTGTINGAGNYGFMLTAIDGAVTGGGGIDKFRIKIWDPTTNAVIYDNQIGADDNADPATAIESGSIVIHTKK